MSTADQPVQGDVEVTYGPDGKAIVHVRGGTRFEVVVDEASTAAAKKSGALTHPTKAKGRLVGKVSYVPTMADFDELRHGASVDD